MIVAFGEVMLRLAPPGHLRLRQAIPGRLEATFAGAEANVCAALGLWGTPCRLVTAVPSGPLADVLEGVLRGLSIDTTSIIRRAAGRLGVFFIETGANQRSSTVVYDRDASAISLADPDEYDPAVALAGATWLHVTGITPSLSEAAFRSTLSLVRAADERGLTVSCDLNFRAKLWRWRSGTPPRQLAGECMSQILPHVDLLVANEEDAADVLGIHAAGTSVEKGHINASAYEQVARRIVERFSNISRVAITLRESFSASHNNWGAMLFDVAQQKSFFAPHDEQGGYRPYEMRNIVDRVGAGDAFAAGLIHVLAGSKGDIEHALAFAVAASCLKHSIQGDFNFVTADEVAALVAGQASGRVRR